MLAERLGSAEFAQEAAPDQDSRTWEVVHVTVRDLAGRGEELGRSEEGAWDHAMWRKAARPDPLRDGPYLFREEARLEELPDGRLRSTLTLLRAPNDVVEDEGDAPSPPKLDESEVLEPAEDGRLHLAVELAGFPGWDVPLEVPRGVFGEEADLRVFFGGGECHPLASGAVDLAVENLFDDGRLAVISSDNDPNDDGDPFGPCDVNGQAALPKAVAVGALGDGATCAGDYAHECQVRVDASANGGADVKTPNIVTRSGALSLIGLVAVDGALYRSDTDCNDPASVGLVHDGLPVGVPSCGSDGVGSSFAAPVVTAAAALVHEWATDTFGPTPVDGVGRLHALMLGMGDSHDLDEGDTLTEQRATRAERRFGMGRLKLKRPTIALLTGATLTDAAPTASLFVSGSALPSGTDFAKCVALQHEDMSSKSVVSDVDLILQRRTSVGGTCTMLGTAEISALIDDSYDVKKMAAFRTNLNGNCLRVTLDADDVAGTSMNVSLFCYASSEDDDEPS